MPEENALLEMGRLGKAHGLKGELYLTWHGESLPRPSTVLKLLHPDGKFVDFKLAELRMQSGRPVIRLQGIVDRTGAEALTNLPVYVSRADVIAPDEDEAFLADLQGCQVYLTDGLLIGTLDHVEFPAGQQIWVINTADGQEVLFPAQPCFIDKLLPAEKRVIISPPPGLLDIYKKNA